MTDRTAAEVMCCPSGCEKDTRSHKTCCAGGLAGAVENLHAAGFMIVPREPTDQMAKAAANVCGSDVVYRRAYRAMTDAGELK